MGQQSLGEWPLFMLALGAFLTDGGNLLDYYRQKLEQACAVLKC